MMSGKRTSKRLYTGMIWIWQNLLCLKFEEHPAGSCILFSTYQQQLLKKNGCPTHLEVLDHFLQRYLCDQTYVQGARNWVSSFGFKFLSHLMEVKFLVSKTQCFLVALFGKEEQLRTTSKVKKKKGKMGLLIKNNLPGAPGRLSKLSVWLLILAQVMISQFLSSSPTWGSELTTLNLLGILCLPLSAPPLLALYLSILKIEKKICAVPGWLSWF